jgi:nucleoside-diphosphate-sugar epimerase
MKLFCFGLGFTAQTLINRLTSARGPSDDEWQFSGTHTSSGEFIFNGTSPLKAFQKHSKDITHLLISIPPSGSQDLVLKYHYDHIVAMPKLQWVGYLSATSVYGNHDGNWVYEDTATNPTDGRGKARCDAEKEWLAVFQKHNIPLHIFRLGGIYGPSRNQLIAVQKNTAKKIIKPGHYFSRIHVDDICGALISSINKPNPGKKYNIVDDEPASSEDVLNYICDILNLPYLKGTPFEQADLSPMSMSFYADNKRVSNIKTKEELNWQLKFPSYREGYSDILSKLNKG